MLSRYDALISRLASYRFLLVFFVLFGLFGGLILFGMTTTGRTTQTRTS